MGHRANYAIQRDGNYDLYYSNWGALTVPQDVFWGPDYAEAFIRDNAAVDHDEWLDDVVGEGGAVLDRDTQTIVLFGGELLNDPPYRTIFLELMQGLWGRWGWTVEWADWGIPDLAEQVGEDPMTFTSGPTGDEPPPPEALGARYDKREIANSLVTIVEDRVHRDCISAHDIEDVLGSGPDILEGLDQLPSLDQARDDYTDDEDSEHDLQRHIRNCLIVDRDQKRIDFWGHARLGELAMIEEAWSESDWTLERHTDHLDYIEAHFEHLDRDVPDDLIVEWNLPSRDEIIERVAERLFEERDVDPASNVRQMVAQMDANEEEVQVDPHALSSPADGRPDEETCQKRFGWALAAVTRE